MEEERKLAIVGIVAESREAAPAVNEVLHAYAEAIVGRMGLPYRDRGVSVISVILDAPRDVINTVTGKLGMIPGVAAKTVLSK